MDPHERRAALLASAIALLGSAALLLPPEKPRRLAPGLGVAAVPAAGRAAAAPARGAADDPDAALAAAARDGEEEDLRDALLDPAARGSASAARARTAALAASAPNLAGGSRSWSLSSDPRTRQALAAGRSAAAGAPAAAAPPGSAAGRPVPASSSVRLSGPTAPRGAALGGSAGGAEPGAASDSGVRRAEERAGRTPPGAFGGGAGSAAHAGGGRGRASLFETSDPSSERAEQKTRRRRGRKARAERSSSNDPEAAGAKRFKPLLLRDELGAKPLRPPAATLEPPQGLLALPSRRPALDASGRPTPDAPVGLASVEGLDPSALTKDRQTGAHWDGGEWHDGAARGVEKDGAWLWAYRSGGSWWSLAGQPPQPLVNHDGVWWLKQQGVWFAVHQGEPWAWRGFADWGAQGLFHPGSGTQIVYSSDYSRAAVVTPGQGAEVFDAHTGALLERIPEEQMPAKRRPQAPEVLPTPQ